MDFKKIIGEFPPAFVVFLVALPLCLGVAVASDATPLAGLVAGIVGGIVVGALSGSSLSVSGPAAGLTAIVSMYIGMLPSYEMFLVAVIIAGILQVVAGYLKAGVIGNYIPNAVIKGMLAAIGLTLIFKQLPHLLGYDKDYEGDESFFQPDGENTITELISSLNYFAPTAVFIGLVSLLILIYFQKSRLKNLKIFQYFPPALIVVLLAVLVNNLVGKYWPQYLLTNDHLVNLPVFERKLDLIFSLPRPDWSAIANLNMWKAAITIACVASIETLLSIEAIDKLDPQKRITPSNRELKAQGVGNLVSGLLGGLPLTSVIVRSSANVMAGAKSKLSTILHGCLLLLSVLLIPEWINLIPLSVLAAILILTGFKLCSPAIIRAYYKKGFLQFTPFVITIVAIFFTDLLVGILIGCCVGLLFVLMSNFKSAVSVTKDGDNYLIRLRGQVSYLNKPLLKAQLEKIPDSASVLIDGTKTDFIDPDVVEIMNDFIMNADLRNVKIYIKRDQGNQKEIFIDFHKRVTE